CWDGQLIPIYQNDTVFNLIGTTYGGDGQETFALPNLQSRVPVHAGTLAGGNTYSLGEAAGVESVTLSTNQIPVHNHAVLASSDFGQDPTPANDYFAQPPTGKTYTE